MTRPLVEPVARQRWRDHRQRAWLRVACLAEDRADPTGHARFSAREIGRVLGLDRQQVSRAIALARAEGWLDPESSARCLVLPGADLGGCEAVHRTEQRRTLSR